MGAKDWLLAFGDGDPGDVLRNRPALDHAAARRVAERIWPGRTLTPIADGLLGEDANPAEGVVYVGAFDGLVLVCTDLAALDRPSELPQAVREAVPASRVYLHAMHSAVDWFACAVWIDGQLRRSLSLSPDSGILENVGDPWPFEQPYWSGQHPLEDPEPVDPEFGDPDDEPYPFPFHPLELAETALQELFGFCFEGEPRPDDVDPFDVPLAGFTIS